MAVNYEFYLGYLQEYRFEVTYRRKKWFKDSCITNAHPSMYDSQKKKKKAVNMEHTEQPTGRLMGWRMSFPTVSFTLNLFQVAQLGFASHRWLVWPQSLQLVW